VDDFGFHNFDHRRRLFLGGSGRFLRLLSREQGGTA